MTTAATLPDLDAFCARCLAAWNDHAAAAMAALVTEDVVWEEGSPCSSARRPRRVGAWSRRSSRSGASAPTRLRG